MLRPVDLQQILTQSNSMERVQQTQQQHPDMQQRYFSVQLSEERKLLKEAVKNSEEAEKAKIRNQEEKDKDKRKTHSEQESEEKAEIKQDAGELDSEQGGLIDIKV